MDCNRKLRNVPKAYGQSYFRIYRCLHPKGNHRQYLEWVAARWDEFVASAEQSPFEILKTDKNRYVFFEIFLHNYKRAALHTQKKGAANG